MRKHDQGSAAAARDRKGRFSARRKRATVLRLLRGEDLESVSRELGITAARGWGRSDGCETLPTSTSVHTARPVGPPAGLLLALNARASRPMDTYLARAR